MTAPEPVVPPMPDACPHCGRRGWAAEVPPFLLVALFVWYANSHSLLGSCVLFMVVAMVWALGALAYGLWRSIRADPEINPAGRRP